jgi:protein farnesyltransferase subunit beta
MRLEGGFQGRPNKLVDGCYSFWVGGLFPLLQPYDVDDYGTSGPWLYDERKRRIYVFASVIVGERDFFFPLLIVPII